MAILICQCKRLMSHGYEKVSWYMKVLFVSLYHHWTPHFETELELMLNHHEHGDEIFILVDQQQLSVTTANPRGLRSLAMKGYGRFRAGMKAVAHTRPTIMPLCRSSSHLLPYFSSLEELKAYTVDGLPFGLALFSTVVSLVRDHRFCVKEHALLIRDLFTSAWTVYQSFLQAIDVVEPDVVYFFNGRFAETGVLLSLCQKRNISFYTHERGAHVGNYALHKNCLPHEISHAKKEINYAWGDGGVAKEQLAWRWFNDRRAGAEQSWISQAQGQQKGLLPVGFDHTKKNIVIFNSSMDEYESIPEWNGNLYENENDGIKHIINDLSINNEISIYVRVHPNLRNLSNTQLRELRGMNTGNNVTMIWPDEPVDSYALMQAADKVLVFASTVGVEACLLGRPVILLGRALYEDLDCVYTPHTHEATIDLLRQQLSPKSTNGALCYIYWLATRGIPFKYFKPEGLFSGTFSGTRLEPSWSWWERLWLKFYYHSDMRR